jgi:membrane-bound lytic murein transglycosylase D
LKYLAVIESELKTSALSCVGALGPWQLMPETAQDLGLKINRHVDERTNYSKSTKAAALYLKDLYAKFGDWLLVLAAYNSGPGPVYAAIHKSGSKNFWALQDYLPAETRGHVKRFIATHYHFEGKGSVTTLTKAENIEYSKTVNTFTLSQAKAEASVPAITAVTRNSEKACGNEKAVSVKESSEQRFKRLMKDSEQSLQKSNQLIGG